jgi:hypothetical protein
MEANQATAATYSATELQTLHHFLDDHRQKMVEGVSGLDGEELCRALVPSGNTLIGMVKHLGYIERWWFQIVFAGLDVPLAAPGTEWSLEPGETTDQVLSFYLREIDRSRELTADALPEDRAAGAAATSRGPASQFTLRWIMLHMIEETAQHNGHADILRELITAARQSHRSPLTS